MFAQPAITPMSERFGPTRVTAFLLVASLAVLAVIFWPSILRTLDIWQNSPEYNYGLLVPPLAALMLWRDLVRGDAPLRGGWFGVGIVLVGLLLGLIEFLSQTQFPGLVGLFLSCIGLFVAWQGEARARQVWPGLVLLLFGLPMANGIQVILTSALQLVSSIGAVGIIRAFDIPVLREGNIIDLGSIKLQVAEACSGLRYMFPLATFSFLCAYLFVGNPAQRSLIFLSSIPITIFMNIVRIGGTGILVDEFGTAAAEGFFHDFEGWVIYCGCLLMLMIVMKALCYTDGGSRSLLQRLDLDLPRGGVTRLESGLNRPLADAKPLLAVAALGVLCLGVIFSIGTRPEYVPARSPFAVFPRQIGDWNGVEQAVDREALEALDATDHLSLNYFAGDDAVVNVWSAYYQSQFSGSAAHSPLVCIPGGGWQIEKVGTRRISIGPGANAPTMNVNRLIIAQGSDRQLVYYWFIEGGVVETDEYLAKARLLMNSVLYNRRDGALVRFVTPILSNDVEAADRVLGRFIAEAVPELAEYLP
jgi:exosortase D (VPLPA-CTERM-specific)